MRISHNQSSYVGSRSDLNPWNPEHPARSIGDGSSGVCVNNQPDGPSTPVVDEMHHSECRVCSSSRESSSLSSQHHSESRVCSSSRGSSSLSSQHRLANQLMKNSGHVKRPTSEDSESSKRSKSEIWSGDHAEVLNSCAFGPGTNAREWRAAIDSKQTSSAGFEFSHRQDSYEASAAESVLDREARLRLRIEELRDQRSHQTDLRRKLQFAVDISEAELDLFRIRELNGFELTEGQLSFLDLKIEHLESKLGLLSHDYRGSSLEHYLSYCEILKDHISSLVKQRGVCLGVRDAGGIDVRRLPTYREESLPANLPEIESVAVGQFFVLESQWLKGSGIGRSVKGNQNLVVEDTFLYIRQKCVDQFRFIWNNLNKHACIGLILGQPGTGKSTTTFLSAGSLARYSEKIVLWVHIGMEDIDTVSCDCVLMYDANCIKFRLSSASDFQKLCSSDWGVRKTESRQHIIFFDGYTKETPEITKIVSSANKWSNKDRQLRHFFVLSSMGATRILSKHSSATREVLEFQQSPWTFDEYLCALSNPQFRKSVAKQLAPVGREEAGMEELENDSFLNMRLKFHCAGACARFMFQFSTAEVKRHVEGALREVEDAKLLLSTAAGHCSSRLKHSLVNVFQITQRSPLGGDDVLTYRTLVSEYVEVCVGRMLQISPLVEQAKLFETNPVMLGWIFEEFFFKKICADRLVPLFTTDASEAGHFRAGSSPFFIFDPEFPTAFDCPVREWLRPRKFNQGGFDAVRLEPGENSEASGSVIFIQCTTAEKHDAKLHYCKNFIDRARKKGIFVATKVEFYFIVPFRNLRFFSIGSVISPQSFAALGSSSSLWGQNDDEVRRNLTVRGIRGWISET